MKIKSIDDFTLKECQEYLDTNPNGEFAQEVAERMEYLQQLKSRKMRQDNDRRINEFSKEFDRHCATQRYEEAFAVCLKYINNVDDKSAVLEKAKSIIHKLKNCIQLPSSMPISYDWLIDLLVLNGYSNMKYNGRYLKLNKALVKIHTKGKVQEITCRSNPLVLLVSVIITVGFLFIYDIFLPYFSIVYMICIKNYFISDVEIYVVFCFLVFWFIKTQKQTRAQLRKLAHIIVESVMN